MLDVMDVVLDKGVVVETADSGESAREIGRAIGGIGLVVVDARVDVATDVDPTLADER